MKPTDAIKTPLTVTAVIPEGVNWTIKLNILPAKVVCRVARRLAK